MCLSDFSKVLQIWDKIYCEMLKHVMLYVHDYDLPYPSHSKQTYQRNMKSIEIGNNTLKTRSPRVTLLTLETISWKLTSFKLEKLSLYYLLR